MVQLKPYNSFGIEARAAQFATFDTPDELRQILSRRAAGQKWMVLGGGNNVLLTGDYDGLIVHPTARGIEVVEERGDHVHVRVEAGLEWDDLVAWSVERGLWGLERLSLIPGYAGAAPVQNIGAYGSEVKDVLEAVEVLYTDDLREATLTAAECRLGYRDSIFKGELRGKAVILAIRIALSRRELPTTRHEQLAPSVAEWTPAGVREAVVAIRRAKLPDPKELGNAGSFFKNPIVSPAVAAALKEKYPAMPLYGTKLSAGWLIEQAGWKGRREGAVGVHERQALVLVNHGGATGRQILDFAGRIVADVEKKFGVTLEMEVNVV